MTASWFYSGDFNNFSDEFFDNLGDVKYYDFSLENIEPNDAGEDWQMKLQNLETPPLSVLESLSSDLCFERDNTALKAMKSSLVSYDQSSQLKHWPTPSDAKPIITTPLLYNSSEGKSSQKLRTCSPISVLESSSSSSSCSAENPNLCCPKFTVPVKRPRSKRCFTPRRSFPPMAFPCVYKKYCHFAASELDADSHDGEPTSASLKRKQKKKKNLTHLTSEAEATEPSMKPAETRKCTHCLATKTPQWREGPMGPKTLCNACGVRYRSGRLFPEYRPAASPTFVPSVHSNSHRKVLEMRKKTGEVTPPMMKPPIFSMEKY